MISTPRERLVAALTGAAISAYAVSWFLPALTGGGDPSVGHLDDLRGWQAFQATAVFSPLVLKGRISGGSQGSAEILLAVLGLATAVSNIVFVVAAASPLLRRGWTLTHATAIGRALWACAVIDLLWVPVALTGLRAGYFLWVAAFALLASAMTATRLSHVDDGAVGRRS